MLPQQRERASYVIGFTALLCCLCAFLMAVTAIGLKAPQEDSKRFDRSTQMLIAAALLDHDGTFLLNGHPARFHHKHLIPTPHRLKATRPHIEMLAALRLIPLFTNHQGAIATAQQAGIDLDSYLTEHKKRGYASQPWKLFYAVLPNDIPPTSAETIASRPDLIHAVIIPVSGLGLWAPIYGYIAIQISDLTVLGTTWYDMAETPGLGANITTAAWQRQFRGKQILHHTPNTPTTIEQSDLGIIVVKGRVADVYGSSPLASSAVDGISGATITGNGVTEAYVRSLTPYRPLLIALTHQGTL